MSRFPLHRETIELVVLTLLLAADIAVPLRYLLWGAFREVRDDRYQLYNDWGTDTLRKGLADGDAATTILARWRPALTKFKALRAKYLIYR